MRESKKLEEIKKLVNSLNVFTPHGYTCSWVNPEQAAEVVEKIRKIVSQKHRGVEKPKKRRKK